MTATFDWSFFSDEGAGSRAREGSLLSLRDRARALNANQNGAIMMIGCFMACFLIGALWSIIGIGDAIVFRDQMQEVADHAAFTSAVLHAKGMNFISACNLVMLAFIFFHILFGIINDILFLACFIPFVDIVACPAFEVAHNVYVDYGNDVMKPACTGIHYVEMVAGYGYPWLGSVKGYTLGTDYGHDLSTHKRDLKVFVVSPSLVPGTILDPLINSFFKEDSGARRNTGQTNSEKLGLPVSANPYNSICKKIAQDGLDALLGFLHAPYLDLILDGLKGLIGAGVNFRYCNSLGFNGNSTDLVNAGRPDTANQVQKVNDHIPDVNKEITDKNSKLPDGATKGSLLSTNDTDTGGKGLAQLDPGLDQWWGHDGPYYPWSGTSNGSAWQEVWALNMSPSFVDGQEHAVAMAKGTLGQQSTAEAPFAYFAEAEFYFDCNKKWSEAGCDNDNNAGFSVQWRARLRRTEFPNILQLLTTYGGDFIGNMSAVTGAFTSVRNKIIDVLPIKALQGVLGGITKWVKSKAQAEIEKVVGGLGPASSIFGGAYH